MLENGLAVVFDLDGVIVHSMPLHTEAWEVYLRRLGVDPAGIVERMHGRRNDEIVADFLGDKVSAEEIFAHGAAKEALFREMMGSRLEEFLVPGIREFLGRLDGVPLGVATNAEPANVSFVLDNAGIRQYFGAIVDGMQVARPKPQPDVYLEAARRLNVPAANCIVFEDSPAGIRAASAAGMRVAGIATTTRDLSGVAGVFDNFLDPGLVPWLRSLTPVV